MVERIQAEMATSIALDTLKATNSLRGLNDAVTSVKNAWKAQEAAAKSSGDYLKASQERYNGLSREMEAQKNKITELQQRQKGLDTSTKEGAESFLKYERNIQQANQKLASLESQQQRAKSSMEYQTSGLAKLQQEYKQMNQVSDSYVNRLKAEHNTRAANITSANSMKASLSNLSQQYVKQSEELKRIEQASGSASDAYKRQAVRVNETATNVANMKNELKLTQAEVNRTNPYGLSKYASGANGAYRAAEKMGNGFHAAGQKIKDMAYSSSIAIVGIGAVSIKGAQAATNLQESYVKTLNLATTGGEKAAEAQKNVNQMQKDGAKYSVQYGKSQQAIAEGYQELIKRGYTSAEALGAMKSELQASVASGDDFNDVLSVTSQVVDAYGMRTDNAAKMTKNTKEVVNQLAYAADMTATDFQSLGKGMEYVGDSAHSAGFKLSETSAAMGILSNHGLEADKAGTGLRKVINSITGALSDQDAAQKGSAASIDSLNEKIADHQKKIADYQAAEKAGTKSSKSAASAIKTQQEAIEKLNGKIQAIKSGGTGDMLSKLGISRSQLVDSNGNLRDMTTIMGVINEKTKNMGTAQKNSVFNSLFGTTGQQAGIILAQNNKELDELNKKVEKSADGQGYVANLAKKNMTTVKAELQQFSQAGQAVMIMIGKQMLPVISEAAVKMAKAFNSKEGQDGLKKIADGVAWVGDKLVGLVEYIGTHTGQIKAFAEVFAGIWAFKKISDTIGWIKTAIGTYKEFNGVLKTTAALNTAANATGSVGGKAGAATTMVETAATTRAAGAGGGLATVSTGAKVASVASKVVSELGIALTAADVGGSIATAISSKKSSDKISAASKGAGAVIGGGIGAILGSIIPGAGTMAGAAIGAGIGDSLGSTKTAQSITKKLNKALKKAFSDNKITIKAPKVDTKDAYSDLNKASKKYYSEKQKQDLQDIKLLKKNGYLTEQEYQDRLKTIKEEGKKANSVEKLSQSDRTALTKYYSQQRQKLETSYNKTKQKDSNKWDSIIAKDAAKYGENSLQVQKDYKKKEQALAKDDQAKKKAVNKLTVKNATETTVEEAKLHTTLTGKIKLSNNEQVKLMDKLTKDKGRLTNKQLQDITSKSREEYNNVKKYADKKLDAAQKAADEQLKKVTKAADKQRDNVVNAAKNQYKDAKKAADKQRDDTIKASENQFKGNSQWAKDQRKNVRDSANKQHDETVKAAKDQRDKTVDAANKQHDDIVGKATSQRNKTSNAATQQRNEVVDKADKQKNSVLDAAGKQGNGVVNKAVLQANGSMEAASKQAKGTHSIWKGLGDFFNGLVKGFGIKSVDVKSGGDFVYKPATMQAFATGSRGVSGGEALVGEAGIEARYSPYSGKVDFLGTNGAQVVNLNPGDKILNASDTAKLFQGGLGKTLPGYAKGTSSIESFLSSMTKGASDIWEDVSDATSEAIEKLTNPVKTLTDMASKIFDVNKLEVGDTGHNSSSGMVKTSIEDGFGKMLSKLKSGFESSGNAGGGKGAPSGAGVTRWRSQVVDALKANGLSTSSSMVDKVLRQIQTESGGNEKAVQGNIGDVNNASGDLAKGLMQVISATFNAYKFPGHNNPFNGYDSLLAGLNYAKHTYGNDLSFLGQGHGYANGTITNTPHLANIAEGGMTEAVIPWDLSKKSRAMELLGETVTHFAQNTSSNTNVAESSDNNLSNMIEATNKTLNSVVELLAGILGQTTEANQSVDDIAMNKFSKAVIARAVRSAN
ncbi:phage tail tape measure protein [Leuconostoc mesenteroides]|uniref:phage tail tape measure protein n=1 Tax=Leuconostoc mesenteroides TaxID=1245 RepID=UPI0021E6006F|nr:phage tail tape measure protein [Leuconostoc mesenteroides]MCV2530124.1 phage tail tape measure protein [Leuconostoc mesenteroides]WVI89978.1 phage tail tape measure protein [Leuconostoc mesenteroides]